MLEHLRPHLAQAMRLRADMLNADLLAHSGMQALDSMAMAMILLDRRAVCMADHYLAVQGERLFEVPAEASKAG